MAIVRDFGLKLKLELRRILPDVIPTAVSCRFSPALRTISFVLTLCLPPLMSAAPLKRQPPATAASPKTGSKLLTVDRIYSAPSLSGSLVSGMEWSPDGKRLSFLERDKSGLQEFWTIEAATGKRSVLLNGRQLLDMMQTQAPKAVQATGLGRVQADNYLWSPGSEALLFIGDNALELLDLKAMAPKMLISGGDELQDPKFSPDGRWVSFVRDANLWLVNVASGETRALTTGGSPDVLKGQLDWVYPEELDLATAYWWSPDSTKIAYLEMDERPVTQYPIMDMSSPLGTMEYTRFPQAGEANPTVRVGVVATTGGDTTWMDSGPNTDVYLARVNWLRDSAHLAIQRLNRAQNRLDLLFCDAATGASKTVLTETDKYWINISDDLYFFSDNRRFLWSSERTGFRHYYLYDLSGKQLDQLTSGEWSVTGTSGFGPGSLNHPAVDEVNGNLYFRSNKDDVRETQLYRLSLRDKSITRVTTQPGTHEVMLAPDESAFEDTYSNAMTPPRQDLFRSDGERVAVIDENSDRQLSDYALSAPDYVTLDASDGTKLYGMMIKPTSFDSSRKYPVLIDAYGGPQVQTVRNEWGGIDFLWLESMAEKGYLIFRLDNRGTYNRGHAFETPIYHHLGKVELEDQLAGVNYLKSLGYVDASRIGIWGWSYGGYMTLEALFEAPGVFKAGIAVAPVSDWRLYDTIYTERYMGRPQDNPEGYTESSPARLAANLKGALMLAHGTGDDNVHFANTVEVLNEMIRQERYPADVMIFPGRGHSIGDLASRIDLYKRMTDFLLNHL